VTLPKDWFYAGSESKFGNAARVGRGGTREIAGQVGVVLFLCFSFFLLSRSLLPSVTCLCPQTLTLFLFPFQVTLGDIVAVIYQGHIEFGIYADHGPAGFLGRVSVSHLLSCLLLFLSPFHFLTLSLFYSTYLLF
jgi:hypothetical protein